MATGHLRENFKFAGLGLFVRTPNLEDATLVSSGTAGVGVLGNLSKTLNDATLASTGEVLVEAALSQTLEGVTLDGQGQSGPVGVVSGYLRQNLKFAGLGLFIASPNLADATLTSIGTVAEIEGQLLKTLEDATLAASDSLLPNLVITPTAALDFINFRAAARAGIFFKGRSIRPTSFVGKVIP